MTIKELEKQRDNINKVLNLLEDTTEDIANILFNSLADVSDKESDTYSSYNQIKRIVKQDLLEMLNPDNYVVTQKDTGYKITKK